jgi:predicted DCC family thiol-disulfide oxidoreductase YuxK
MPGPRITILMDGACPLCRQQAISLALLDLGRHRLAIEDIAAPGFDPGRYGLSMDECLEQIHAVLPSGRVVTGFEVFRRAYDAIGLGWLLAPTGWAVLRPLADAGYRLLARHRLRLPWLDRSCTTGRCGHVSSASHHVTVGATSGPATSV